MATESLFLRRTVSGFEFASEYDRELAGKWGVGAMVRADLHKPRSGKFNRWYRALVRVVWKHQDHFRSPEALHKAIKYRLGEYDAIRLRNGEVLIDFWSTGYEQMEAGAFREHVNRTWDIITNEIIPGLDVDGRQQLTAEIDRLLMGSI